MTEQFADWRVRAGVIVAGFLALWAVAAAVSSKGLPFGILLLGVVIGALNGLTAMGLVLVYRSTRIINFAQAELGALAATMAFIMVAGWHWSYWVAMPAALAIGTATGALVELTVVRRLFRAPRLILTVATIGVLQIIGAAEINMPRHFARLSALQRFHTPFKFSRRIGPVVFTGDYWIAIIVIPVALALLALFLSRSDTGLAVRAAADSSERALLLGIPVRRLSLIAWTIASALSSIGALLTTPILGPKIGVLGGPTALLTPLTAAVVARMESLPIALIAAIALGAFQQAVFWIVGRSSVVDALQFLVILGALLLQHRRATRVDESGLGGHEAVREVRPVPEVLRSLPFVRGVRIGGLVALLGIAVAAPYVLATQQVILTYTMLYGIVAVSLVLLTGWAGQISLGQFAFVGIGASITGALLVHAGADLLIALVLSTLGGALSAFLVGLPALRIRGLFLAVTTLAFGVPVTTWLLNSAHFPTLAPSNVRPPVLLDRFPLESWRTLYFVALAMLVIALVLARNLRRSRAGRAIVAVRDNERAASVFAISPMRTKLAVFAISGGLAGFAGGLYVVAQRKIGFAGFDPVLSVQVFTAAVVGGLGSLPGALLGAIYVQWALHLPDASMKLLATGAGLLGLLLVIPGGLGALVYQVRDAALRELARRRGIAVPSLSAPIAEDAEPADVVPTTDTPPLDGLLVCDGVDTGYGNVQVLFGVDLAVADGEVAALLGTNGAGKSTLLRVIAGLLPAHEGRVTFAGSDITALDPVERVQAGIVTMPGGRGIFGSLTVAQNLRLARWLRRHDGAASAAAIDAVLEQFPQLARRIDEPASLLSGGEQQMLTLAQALLCEPRLLLIDELSLGLAPTVVASLLNVLRDVNAQGTTVVIVEQSVNVASTVAGRAVFLEKGAVQFDGATAELLERPDLLRSVLLGRARERAVAAAAGHATAPSTNGQGSGLIVENVVKRFGGVQAIDGVDLRAAPGQIVGVIGANGAGKTTLFDICSGFVRPDAGFVWLDGMDVTDLPAHRRASLGLGRSFQDARMFPSLTVSEALAVAFERHIDVRDPLLCALRTGAVVESEREVRGKVDELIERFGLDRWRDNFVSELSTGTRRVVDLACAFALEPKVLLLDEPSSGIAQRESEALADLLLAFRRDTGAALVVVEHDIPLVASVADELVCLALGQVIARGTPTAVLSDETVIASYLGTDEATVQRSAGAAKRPTRSRARKASASA
jgi:ABC-type branched-subunit amino acid transport system ATPase component/ABC-type branched-subunit amino acid transport system permease subunit